MNVEENQQEHWGFRVI